MTIEKADPSAIGRLAGAGAVLAAAFMLLACASAHEARHGDRVDVSGFPPEIQASYKVFATRCSRCHTLARPLNARISDPQHWIRYVARMRLQPASGIDAKNGQIILRFLLYYHDKNRANSQDPKTGGTHD